MTIKRFTAEGGTVGAAVAQGQAGSGDPLDVTVVTNSATLTYDTAQAMHGTKSVKVTPTATGAAVMYYNTATSAVATHMYVYATALPTSDTYIMRYETSGGATSPRLIINSAGKLRIQDAASTVLWTATNTLPLNQWVRLEMFCKTGADTVTGTLKFGAYLGDSTTPIEAVYTNTAANTQTGAYSRISVGKPNASQSYASVFWIDDFTTNDAATDFIGPGANLAPVVTAGTTTTVATGAAFSLPFTASDPDGNTLTYTAAADPGNPAALGTLTVTSTTVTGTAPTTAGKYVVNVTANDGTTTTTAPLTLYVTSVSSKPYAVKANAGGWTATGGTIPGVLADTDTATYVESPDNPTGAIASVTTTPYSGSATASISYAVSQNPATPARSVAIALYMGNTLIATKTETLTAGITTGTLDLTAPQLAAWTDRNEPELRFTAS